VFYPLGVCGIECAIHYEQDLNEEYRIYSIVSHGLCFFIILCSLQSRAAYIIFSLAYRMVYDRWRLVFPWLRFVDQTLFSLSSLQHHVHTLLRRMIMMNKRQLQWWSIIT